MSARIRVQLLSVPYTSCTCFSSSHKLDEPKAEQLLRENQQTKAMLERYPGGMQSLDTGMTGTPNRKEEHSDIVTIASSPVPEFDCKLSARRKSRNKQKPSTNLRYATP